MLRVTRHIILTAATQVEVLEQRCTDAEKTKEEAREAAAKARSPLCHASHAAPALTFPPPLRSKPRCGTCTSSG